MLGRDPFSELGGLGEPVLDARCDETRSAYFKAQRLSVYSFWDPFQIG